jgi:hypothetical protein
MRWEFDADTRTLTFSENGAARVIAQVRMVGSGTFQWSWHTYGDRNDPIVGGLADLEGFGEVRGIERLQKAWWACEPAEGWEMTALAGYLFGCDAAYRAPLTRSTDTCCCSRSHFASSTSSAARRLAMARSSRSTARHGASGSVAIEANAGLGAHVGADFLSDEGSEFDADLDMTCSHVVRPF